jgi:hypothetical protein
MFPPEDPVTSPVTFSFENGAIKLVTVIDPVAGYHTVVIYVIKPFHLAFRQPVSHCSTIRDLIPAQRSAFKRDKKRQKSKYW